MKRIDKSKIIDERSWLKKLCDKKGGNIILSTDLDGWEDGLLLTSHCNAKVVGLYNNGQLVINKNYKAKDCIFIDADVAIPHIISFGHHITDYSINDSTMYRYHPQGLQVNNLDGVKVISNDPCKQFPRKYPFSTMLFTMELLDFNLMDYDPYQKFLMIYPDGATNSYIKFPDSADQWIEAFFGPHVDQACDTLSLKDVKDLTKIYRRQRKDCIPTDGEGKGSEKISNLMTNDSGKLILPHAKYGDRIPQIKKFIKTIGDEIRLPYEDSKWVCWDDLNIYNFNKGEHTKGEKVKKMYELLDTPEEFISLIFSDTTGKMNYTTGDPDIIKSAFGDGDSDHNHNFVYDWDPCHGEFEFSYR